MLPCAGAVGVVYEDLGGDVYWAGKPHAPAYTMAFEVASGVTGRRVAPAEVLAIGDAVATDIAGAAAAGIDALFIAGGIHRAAAMPAGAIEQQALTALFTGSSSPVAAASALVW